MLTRVRRIILSAAGVVPQGVKRWLYRHPRLLSPAARLLRLGVGEAPTIVTIRSGPLAGMKLAVDRGTPGFYWMADVYEAELVPVFHTACTPGAIVADVGAHIGYDTLMMARLVGPTGRVLAFEPDPGNRVRLERNRTLNELHHVTIFPLAVSDLVGTARFDARDATTSRLADSGAVEVQTLTLDALVYEHHQPPPAFIKIDVEGAEDRVLRGAARLLREHRPAWLIEVHSAAALRSCVEQLRAVDYVLESVGDSAQARAVTAAIAGQRFDEQTIERAYLAARPRRG